MEATQVEIPKKAVRALKSRLHVVREHLKPLLEKPLSEIFTKLPIQERYELQVLLSYSLNSLYYIYLRTQGSDPQKHEVMNELLRVQQYIQKFKKAQGKEEKPTLKVDKDAAARFIKSAINENKVAVETEIENKKRELEEEVDISSDEEEEKPTKDNKKRKMDAFSSNKSSKKNKKNNKQ